MKRFMILLCVLLAFPAFAFSRQNGFPATPLKEYQALVEEYGEASEEKISPAQATQLQQRFQRVKQVALPGGQTVSVNNQAAIDDLEAIARGTRTAKLSRSGVERANALWYLNISDSANDVTKGDVRAEASKILSAPEFAFKDEPDAEKSWWDKQMAAFEKWLRYWLNKIFGGMRPAATPDLTWLGVLGEAVKWILIFALVAGVIALVVFLVSRYYGPLSKLRVKKGMSATGLDLSPEEFPDPLGAARERANAGDYRGAVRLTYIASLRRLSESGLLVLESNRTNWEYQRDLRTRSRDSYDRFLPATRLFDNVWYGKREATRAEYEGMVGIHDLIASTPEKTGGPTP